MNKPENTAPRSITGRVARVTITTYELWRRILEARAVREGEFVWLDETQDKCAEDASFSLN